jgi:hypothetical protein
MWIYVPEHHNRNYDRLQVRICILYRRITCFQIEKWLKNEVNDDVKNFIKVNIYYDEGERLLEVLINFIISLFVGILFLIIGKILKVKFIKWIGVILCILTILVPIIAFIIGFIDSFKFSG